MADSEEWKAEYVEFTPAERAELLALVKKRYKLKVVKDGGRVMAFFSFSTGEDVEDFVKLLNMVAWPFGLNINITDEPFTAS